MNFRALVTLLMLAIPLSARGLEPPDCMNGVFIPGSAAISTLFDGTTRAIRGHAISAVEITRDEPSRIRVYGEVGDEACEGTIRGTKRGLRARLDSCIADGGPPSRVCWCSRASIRLKAVDGCSALRGSTRWKANRRPLVVRPGHCGDGFIDFARGEQCDGNTLFGCGPTVECDDQCRCPVNGD